MPVAADVKQPHLMFCWISGWTASYTPPEWNAPWGLHVAHIASGAGKARRLDKREAVVLLSPLCHDLHVSDSGRMPTKWIGGKEWPTIDERHTLYVKKVFDKKYYDLDVLREAWIGNLPEPKRPPEFWCEMMFKNQGFLF